METDDFTKKPLIEQIHDELLASLENHEEFDKGMIEAVRQLATSGDLKKHGRVTDAIKLGAVKKDETTGTGN